MPNREDSKRRVRFQTRGTSHTRPRYCDPRPTIASRRQRETTQSRKRQRLRDRPNGGTYYYKTSDPRARLGSVASRVGIDRVI